MREVTTNRMFKDSGQVFSFEYGAVYTGSASDVKIITINHPNSVGAFYVQHTDDKTVLRFTGNVEEQDFLRFFSSLYGVLRDKSD